MSPLPEPTVFRIQSAVTKDEWDECVERVVTKTDRWTDDALVAACDAVLIAGITSICQHAVHATLRAEMRRRGLEYRP